MVYNTTWCKRNTVSEPLWSNLIQMDCQNMPELLFAICQKWDWKWAGPRSPTMLQSALWVPRSKFGALHDFTSTLCLQPSQAPVLGGYWQLHFYQRLAFFPTSFKVNKVLASNRGNAAVFGQFTLQDNLLGGLKHVETLLNEKDDYCRYWFIISAGFLYILHEQHGLVALHAAGSTAAIASKQCDIQQQHWRLRGLHFHRMVPDAVNRCKLHCTMNTTSPFFSIHVTFNRFQLPFPFQVVEVVFGHLNGHHHTPPL